jgi:hypothetical protein
MPPAPQKQWRDEQRAEKLAEIRRQVKAGTLVIRKMTAAERKKYPKLAADAPSHARRRRGR